MVLTFTPAGIEKWSEETLERAPKEAHEPPTTSTRSSLANVAAAPKYGLESSDGSVS
jgi:hypothetical protein